MRRKWAVCFLLVCLLSGCAGQTGDIPAGLYFHTPEYFIKFGKVSIVINSNTSFPIQKGAVLRREISFFTQTEDIIAEKSSNFDRLIGVFDEDAKTLTPLCFRPDCTHSSNTCFARNFYETYIDQYGAYNGMLFAFYVKRENFIVDYYTPEGVLVKSVSYKPELVNVTGSNICQLNDTLYFYCMYVDDYTAGLFRKEKIPARWQIHSYDLKTETFSFLTEFTLPDATSSSISFEAAFENRLYFLHDQMLYVYDISDNTVTQVADYNALIKELSNAEGVVLGFLVDPVNEGNLIYDLYDRKTLWAERTIVGRHVYNWNTKTVSAAPLYVPQNYQRFRFPWDNNFYCLDFERIDEVINLTVTNLTTGEVTLTPWPQEVLPANYVYFLSQTDNGFLFEIGKKDRPIIDGKEVSVRNPPYVVYMTKKDLLAGNIVWEDVIFPWADEGVESNGT